MSTLSTSPSHEHRPLWLLDKRCEDRPNLNQDSSSFPHPHDKILFRGSTPRLTSFLNSMLDIGDATGKVKVEFQSKCQETTMILGYI